MRFGSFVFPVSHHPEQDSAVIDSTLDEILLAESIGMHSVWLTEHHFDGAAAHADPLVLGAAVAARTDRLKIGFAVVELAFHHPVRLAVQTALLDNLSHGRLIVGTGRGSAYNHYEYIGFGITMEDGLARLEEAEELMVKAWTGEDLKHKGEHWNVEFPQLRPRPYQQPHPPLIRACISEDSTIRMAEIGRPVMIGIQALPNLQSRLERYQATMLDSGFTEEQTEAAFDPVLGLPRPVHRRKQRRGSRDRRGRLPAGARPLQSRPGTLQPRRTAPSGPECPRTGWREFRALLHRRHAVSGGRPGCGDTRHWRAKSDAQGSTPARWTPTRSKSPCAFSARR